jgi:hypothetical protein
MMGMGEFDMFELISWIRELRVAVAIVTDADRRRKQYCMRAASAEIHTSVMLVFSL